FCQFSDADDKYVASEVDPTDGNIGTSYSHSAYVIHIHCILMYEIMHDFTFIFECDCISAKVKIINLTLASDITPEALCFLDEIMAKIVQNSDKGKDLYVPMVNDTAYRAKVVPSTTPFVPSSPFPSPAQEQIETKSESTPKLSHRNSSSSHSSDDREQIVEEPSPPEKRERMTLSEFLTKNDREFLTASLPSSPANTSPASESISSPDWLQRFGPPKVADEEEFPSLPITLVPHKLVSTPTMEESKFVSTLTDPASSITEHTADPCIFESKIQPKPTDHILHPLTLPTSFSVPSEHAVKHAAPLSPQFLASIEDWLNAPTAPSPRGVSLFLPSTPPMTEQNLNRHATEVIQAEMWFRKRARELEEDFGKMNKLVKWADPYEGAGGMLKIILTFACKDTRLLLIPFYATRHIDLLAHIRRKFCIAPYVPNADLRVAYRDRRGRGIVVGDEEDWRVAKEEAGNIAKLAETLTEGGVDVLPELEVECLIVQKRYLGLRE
ncbi:hypothetical protein BC938DRAFT_475917, partial [Jimgerdemannia flammicorona]